MPVHEPNQEGILRAQEHFWKGSPDEIAHCDLCNQTLCREEGWIVRPLDNDSLLSFLTRRFSSYALVSMMGQTPQEARRSIENALENSPAFLVCDDCLDDWQNSERKKEALSLSHRGPWEGIPSPLPENSEAKKELLPVQTKSFLPDWMKGGQPVPSPFFLPEQKTGRPEGKKGEVMKEEKGPLAGTPVIPGQGPKKSLPKWMSRK